jgi:magnesium transporter
VINSFTLELNKVLALASFIPIVLGMGGNIATQSSTIIVRGIATGRIHMDQFFKIIFKEMRVGLILGVIYGILLGIFAFFGYAEPKLLGLVVGVSLFFSMSMAAMVGAFIPLVLKCFDIDAAVATGPFVTTSIDVLGVFVFLWIAKLFLNL